MKILYVTTIGITMGFFDPLVKELIEEGNVVDIATNENGAKVPDCYREWGCKIYSLSTSRSPFSYGNIKAIGEIKKIVKDGGYEIVHCHTPLAAMATRLACKGLRKNGVKVIYTAHGFHFYKGAPKKNWLIYYPMEKLCARWTDVLITINREDYELAQKKMKAKKVEYVPGVGIEIEKFENTVVDIEKKRQELGLPKDAYVLLSVGELNENKNHRVVIEALGKINNSSIHYLIAGKGNKKEELEQLAKERNVNLHLLGYRKDVAELYKTADLFVHPSFREGLPVSVMEALASGTPCIVSNIRGCADLVKDGLFDPTNIDDVAEHIENRPDNGHIDEAFSLRNVNNRMKEIYYDI